MKRVSLYLIMVLILTNIGLAKSTTGTIGTSSVTCWDGIPPQVVNALSEYGYATVSQANSFWATTVSFDYVTVGDGAEAWYVDIAGIPNYLQVSTSGHLVTKNYNGSVSNGDNLYLISILSLEDEGMANNCSITVTATISGTYYITPDLPIISGNNQTICPTATASVSVTNPDPDGGVYWSDGSTSASRNLSPGTYYVRNTGGGLNSSYETVNVNSYTAPGVTNPSNPSAVCAGTGAPSFSVTGSGTGISYQWYQYNGSSWSSLGAASGIYSGTQTSSLTITAPTYSMNGYLYKCTVSGTCSPTATSNTASLTVYTAPTLLATTSASSIAATSATSGGNISSNGGTSVTEHGICWNTASNPTTGNSKTTLGAFATGSYTSGLTGLTQNTLYYVRAYATNTCGTSYGTEISFTSISKAPTVDVASNVTKNTMRATWNAPTSQGSESFTYTLEVDDNNSFSSPAQYTGLNAEYYDIVGLSTYTLYYYRVKAVNAGGNSAWSSTKIQRTDPNWSKISISGGSGILKNDGATTNGGADNIGLITMTQVSTFQYTVSFNFTTDNCCYSNTDGTHVKLFYWNAATSSWSSVYSDNRGAGGPYSPTYNTVHYTHNISALAQQGTYYFRASIIDKASSGEYMTGNYGCNYCGSDGNGANHYDNADISFTLSDMDPPIVSTTSVNTVTKVSAFGTGNITSIGSQACSNRGFSFRSDSTGAGEIDQSGSYGTGSFSSSITGLTSNTKYDISAYATNNGGQVYGSEITITTLPDVTGTSAASQITQTTATLGSTVSRGGGVYLSARGVCWSTSSTPTIANSKTTDATNFISTTALASQTQPASLTGLTSNTKYYVRAYATNTTGTTYGPEVIFTTLADVTGTKTPTFETAEINETSATSGGTIATGGNQSLSSRGVCWSTSSNPTTANPKTSDATTLGSEIQGALTSLTPNTKYYIRAYAINAGGTSYGPEIYFTTRAHVSATKTPTFETAEITEVSATSGGTIDNGGSQPLASRGVCWSTSSSPTTADPKTSNTTTLGSEVLGSLTSLTPNTKYYIRAYSINAGGTTYGPEIYFTTRAHVSGTKTPTFETVEIAETSATSGGTIDNGGSQPLASRGVCWSTSSSPTTVDPKTSNTTTLGSEVLGSLTSLTPNTKYYIRAYSINAGGTTYGPEIYFTTRAHVSATKTPTFETAEITEVSATSGGTIDNGGSQPLASRGVCWSTSSSPTTADPKTSNTTTLGSEVLGSLTSLTPNTKYYIRAYSINAGGTTYGPEIYFTTRAHVSATKTPSINEIVEKSALSGSTILSGGSQPLSSRGVCWSTSPNPTVPSNNKTTDLTTTFDSQVGTTIDESSTGSVINNTKYYVRAYSINAGGTTYGPEIYFTTKANCYISTLTGVTSDSCFVSGAIAVPSGIQGGTELVSERGFVWSNTAASPTVTTSLSSFKKQVGNGYGTIPSTVLKFQVPSETYFVRSYSINAGGTNYSNTVAMTTSLNTPYNGVGSISLNFIHNSGWEDNNNSNTDPSVPNNLSAPADISSDSDFPKDENLGGQGDWKSWEFNGNSQCFQLPYNSSTNRVNNNSQKALFLYFRTSTTTANTPISSRQVLLELGGESSGMNAYIYSGKVWVGIWNSSQRRFFSKSIAVDQTFLLNIEFNGTKVRTALNGECSSSMLFSGFASNSNYNGIGASVNGTRYMDLTRTSGVNDYYKGRLAEVLMFNDCSEILRLIIMNFFDNKYDKNYRSNYTSYFGKVSAETGWEEYESEVSPFDNNEESSIQKLEVFKSVKDLSINLNIDEDENIEIAIFDINGIKVGTISNNELKKGINNFTYSTENLISGVYIVRAIGLNVNESVKINIVK